MVCGNYKGESVLIPVLTKENVSVSFAKLISLVRLQDIRSSRYTHGKSNFTQLLRMESKR